MWPAVSLTFFVFPGFSIYFALSQGSVIWGFILFYLYFDVHKATCTPFHFSSSSSFWVSLFLELFAARKHLQTLMHVQKKADSSWMQFYFYYHRGQVSIVPVEMAKNFNIIKTELPQITWHLGLQMTILLQGSCSFRQIDLRFFKCHSN